MTSYPRCCSELPLLQEGVEGQDLGVVVEEEAIVDPVVEHGEEVIHLTVVQHCAHCRVTSGRGGVDCVGGATQLVQKFLIFACVNNLRGG